ncbi:MAG: MFS transporter [Saprospiraceae bacterium]
MPERTDPLDSPINNPVIPLNDKRIINGWAMFDWANSSYALVIAVAIFPIYFNSMITENGEFLFLGIPVTKTSLFSYSLTFAYLIVSAILPILTGMADYGGKKMAFMKFFTILGSLACIALWWFTGMASLILGVFAFILAVIGFAGGQVFYNSFLPLIATEDQFDRVSAKGFAYGYVGSVILLLINLFMIMNYELFGFPDESWASRTAFVMVGLWWLGFSQITFNRLPKDPENAPTDNLFSKGYQEIYKIWLYVKGEKNIKTFLFSFFFYSAGTQTVIYLASTFATVELNFESMDLILTILLLQFLAIGGAYLFAKVSTAMGNKRSIMIMLFIWISICIAAYFVHSKSEFYIIAGFVGLVMGGIQSLSRSTYSKLIPENTKDTASFFSFFDVLEKLAIVLGTLSFGLIDQVMGGMRNSILALIVFFLLGILLLIRVKIKPSSIKTI